jgi:hypothetical protein
MAQQHIQIAEIEVRSRASRHNYKAAVQEQIEAAIQLEPGVLVLYWCPTGQSNPRLKVFEIYRDRGRLPRASTGAPFP